MALGITPPATAYRYGDTGVGSLAYVATGATGTVHWTTSSGTMTGATGASSVLSGLANDTYTVTITATDDNGSVSVTLAVTATFPYQPKWGVESDYDTVGLTRYPMVAEKRGFVEYWDALRFYNRLGNAIVETSPGEDGAIAYRVLRGKPFYVVEKSSGELILGYFNSSLRRSFESAEWCNYSFQFLAINHTSPSTPTAGPWVGGIT
jgi:hypothetical protein